MQNEKFDEYDIKTFVEYHAKNMPPASYRDFWSGAPLCPSYDLDALEAAKRLHRGMQAWVEDKGYAPDEVQLFAWRGNKAVGIRYAALPSPCINRLEKWP